MLQVEVDALTPSLPPSLGYGGTGLARAWTPSLPARAGCALSLREMDSLVPTPSDLRAFVPCDGTNSFHRHRRRGGYQDMQSISTGMAQLYFKLKKMNVPAELHINAHARHGFGLREGDTVASSKWPDALIAWLYDINGIGSDR